jgi:alpha-amylase
MPFSKAFVADACGYTCSVNGAWQEGVYTRVHRDIEIINAMRKWQGLGAANGPEDLGLSPNCVSNSVEQFL